MNELDRAIRERITTFVDELTELVRQAALSAVRDALGGAPAKASPRLRSAPKRAKKGAKRSGAELDRIGARVLAHIGKNPGERADQIARALGVTTKQVTLPMKKLLKAGAISSKGQKRATKYFQT